jgi:hypothetical protein
MIRPAFIWQVYGHSNAGRRETVASFFESRDAEDMVRNPGEIGFERRNLYCAEPKRDLRTHGYRPTVEYGSWLVVVDCDPSTGNPRIAA